MPLRSTRGERGSSAHFLGSHRWNRCGGSTTWSSTLTKRGISRAMGRPPGSARVTGDGRVGVELLGDAARRLRLLDLAGELGDDRGVAAAARRPEALVALLGAQV